MRTLLPPRPFLLAAVGLSLLVPTHAWAGGTNNTSTGTGALPASTTGSNNTADGFDALAHNTNGNHNTATGSGALQANTTGHENTAAGFDALLANTSGYHNTAVGHETLLRTTTGTENTALGYEALLQNTTGTNNVAAGSTALLANTTGGSNCAYGVYALLSNGTGSDNVAVGTSALTSNIGGQGNTACGYGALGSDTGSYNIGIGDGAGVNLTDGIDNIEIGNVGNAGENDTIRIGIQGLQAGAFIAGIYGNGNLEQDGILPVYADVNGQLGTGVSSGNEPGDIHAMNRSSEAIYALRPVSYRSRNRPGGSLRYGLVADEVEKINPALVAHGQDGHPLTVRYEQVNAMLLNEFLKEHAQVQALAAEVAALRAKCDAAPAAGSTR